MIILVLDEDERDVTSRALNLLQNMAPEIGMDAMECDVLTTLLEKIKRKQSK